MSAGTAIAGVLKSSVTQDSRTPAWLLDRVSQLYFGGRAPHDPCPTAPTRDGLAAEWLPETFVNPPFNRLALWLRKAALEGERGVHAVVLLPARVSAKYFHQVLLPAAHSLVIWCHPVAFPPHRSTFSLPVLLAEFGQHSLAGAGLKTVPYSSWWQPGLTLPLVREHVGGRFPGVELLPLFADVAAGCRAAHAAGVERVLLMPPWFNSAYFRLLLPHVREVVFVGPKPNWSGASSSLLGSVLVHVFGRGTVWSGAAEALLLTPGRAPA